MASRMLDTLTLSRELKDAGIEPKQADAITHVVQQAAEHGDPPRGPTSTPTEPKSERTSLLSKHA